MWTNKVKNGLRRFVVLALVFMRSIIWPAVPYRCGGTWYKPLFYVVCHLQ